MALSADAARLSRSPAARRPGLFTGLVLGADRLVYESLIRPWLFRRDAESGHRLALRVLSRLDRSALASGLSRRLGRAAAASATPVEAGGVRLPQALMLAAGMIKGEGFADEAGALAAVARGDDIIPGWRSLPALVGPVEMGSFTRHPRLGNAGPVMWRHTAEQSLQNRIGLRNPGARAAAAFLARHRTELPPVYGLNIAPTPGLDDPGRESAEVVEAIAAFLDAGLGPSWVTLNLSCPNTESDPKGHQTGARAEALCGAAARLLARHGVPLWVKIGPDLGPAQIDSLLATLARVGARAVVATNTLAAPAPGLDGVTAGISGARLRPHALTVIARLAERRAALAPGLDLIACGGILDGASFEAYQRLGAAAGQYLGALVFRGPLAAAQIERERQSRAVEP